MPPGDDDVTGVGGEMGRECELKFRCPHHAALRASLREQGGVLASCVQECNRLYDRADGSLRARDCGLRVRTVAPLNGAASSLAVLTFKGPRAAGVLKVREEIETHVEDAPALLTILARLGFRPMVEFEKRRETWQLSGHAGRVAAARRVPGDRGARRGGDRGRPGAPRVERRGAAA